VSTSKKQIRPFISNALVSNNQSDAENFQNGVLRPIIKLQHDLLLCFFEEYLKARKMQFDDKNQGQKQQLIDTLFNKDTGFKKTLITMITALFTVEEYLMYLPKHSEFNKRIKQMIKQKISRAYTDQNT
jgi:hypothetical protein